MPYLKQHHKDFLDPDLDRLATEVEQLPGLTKEAALNYIICILANRWFGNKGYTEWSHAFGAIECAKLELYRLRLGPHEDVAIAINGDIFVSPGVDKIRHS